MFPGADPYDAPTMLLAHNVGGGALPAPAVAARLHRRLRGPRHRRRAAGHLDGAPPRRRRRRGTTATGDVASERASGACVGQALGSRCSASCWSRRSWAPTPAAANIAPVAVLVIWWVGLPILCLLLGDVMRAINPFEPSCRCSTGVTGAPATPRGAPRPGPAAAFLAAFAWFFLAYHRPGSPRALAVFLVVYTLAAVPAGCAGAAVARDRRGLRRAVGGGGPALTTAAAAAAGPGCSPLVVVWLGSTAFDAFASTPFWVDVLGTSQGWTPHAPQHGRAGVADRHRGRRCACSPLRIADATRDGDGPPTSLVEPLGVALVPLALGWFVAHDLTLLLFEGQNFYALAVRPDRQGLGPVRHDRPHHRLSRRAGRVGPLVAGRPARVGHVGGGRDRP